MRYVFITGTSRGLGEACLEVFKEDKIISISRTPVTDSSFIHQAFNVDFSDETTLEDKLSNLFSSIHPEDDDEVYLINNAGTVSPVKSVSDMNAEEYLNNYKINVLAPALLIKGFINTFKNHKGQKRILTVSSGAAVNPVEGWGAYCSSKAAVNMLNEVTRLETSRLEHPIGSAVFSPGVMDTDMQGQIRESDQNAFPDIERFKGYKASGKLNSALTVANAVKKVIMLKDFDQQAVYNVNDYI
jgi:benzil reductase ((S)-benzoin forming)